MRALAPKEVYKRVEDDYETEQELMQKACNHMRREFCLAINQKRDRMLRGEQSSDEDPEICMLETGPLA